MDFNLYLNTTATYTSCIVINKRPILPPLLTPAKSDEMNAYRDKAVAVERKLTEARRRRDERWHHITEELDNESHHRSAESPFDRFDSSRSSTIKEFHCHASEFKENSFCTAPSVASTDLTRYMTCEPSWSRPTTGSTVATTITEYNFTTHSSEQSPPSPSDHRPPLVRRASYTLEHPSPVLLAHHLATNGFHHAETDDDLLDCATRESHRSPESADDCRNEPSAKCSLVAKNRHLHRYLSQMASMSLRDDRSSCDVTLGGVNGNSVVESAAMVDDRGVAGHNDGMVNGGHPVVNDGELPSHFGSQNNGGHASTNSVDTAVRCMVTQGDDESGSDSAALFEEMLQEQVQHFRKLKADLEANHRRHMDELRLQFAVDLGRLNQRFSGGSDSVKSDHYNDRIIGLSSGTDVAQPPSDCHRTQSVEDVAAAAAACPSESSGSTTVYESAESSPKRCVNGNCGADEGRGMPGESGVGGGGGGDGGGMRGYDNLGHSCWEGSFENVNDEGILSSQFRLREITRHPGFEQLSAAVKGYLTRRLMRTTKVQNMIDKIKDTLEFAVKLHSESPIRRGRISAEDATLHHNLIAQLSNTCYDFHDVFFTLTTKERMTIIARDRKLQHEKLEKINDKMHTQNSRSKIQNISAATLKAIERRRQSSGRRSNSPAPDILKVSVRSKASAKDSKRKSGHSRRAFSTSPHMNYLTGASPPRIRSQSSLSSGVPLVGVRRSLYGK